MARQAAGEATKEQTEQDYLAAVSDAIRDTEKEVFTDSLGDEPLEEDGDTSLEEMESGPEEEAADADEEETEQEGDEAEEAEPDETEPEEGEVETEEVAAQQGQEERPERDERGRVPPGRLREVSERARNAEREREELRYEVQTLNARLNDALARMNAQTQQPQAQQPAQPAAPPPKPDMFGDPDGYEKWHMEQADKRAEEKINQRFAAYEQRQLQEKQARVRAAIDTALAGPDRAAFQYAFNEMNKIDGQKPEGQAIIQRILNSVDPAKEIFDWAESNLGDEYRTEQLLDRVRTRRATREDLAELMGGDRQAARQPRHETRLPPAMRQRVPSLNGAAGAQRQDVVDPEMLDPSEGSIFRFAMK